MSADNVPVSRTRRTAITAVAAFSLVGGVLHLAMAPVHAQESAIEAVLFVGVGWLQLAFASLVVMRPNRRVLVFIAAANTAVVLAWVASRTVGLPISQPPWTPEPIGLVDVLASMAEMATVALSAALFYPRLFRVALGTRRYGIVPLAVLPVSALLASSLALASPSFVEHSHEAASGECDRGLNPASYWKEAGSTSRILPADGSLDQAAHQHVHASPSSGSTAGGVGSGATTAPGVGSGATPSAGHPIVASFDHGRGSADLDTLLSLSMSTGEIDLSSLVEALASVDDATYAAWLSHVNEFATHAGPQYWKPMTNTDDCRQLVAELDRARQVADRYPTVAQAKAAGYMMTAPFVAGMGSHWGNYNLLDTKFDIDHPELLLYNGNDDSSRLIGLSYLVESNPAVAPTQGFTGDNDEYHTHPQFCRRDNLIVGDSLTTEDACRQLGGTLQREDDRFMMHVWLIPGCESPWGLFSAANPIIDNAVMDSPATAGSPCAGSQVRHRYFPSDAPAAPVAGVAAN